MTGQPLPIVLRMTWADIGIAWEAYEMKLYAAMSETRWLAATISSYVAGKAIDPMELLPLSRDEKGKASPHIDFEQSEERIARVRKLLKI